MPTLREQCLQGVRVPTRRHQCPVLEIKNGNRALSDWQMVMGIEDGDASS